MVKRSNLPSQPRNKNEEDNDKENVNNHSSGEATKQNAPIRVTKPVKTVKPVKTYKITPSTPSVSRTPSTMTGGVLKSKENMNDTASTRLSDPFEKSLDLSIPESYSSTCSSPPPARSRSSRRKRPVSYKEISLNKKLRRGDKFFEG